MRDELERLADRLADIHISDHRPGLWEKMADVEEKLRALAARLPTEKEAMQIDAGGPEQDTPVAPPPSTSGGGDQVPELHVACWEIRWPSTPEGFEEIKYHGTNSVQDYRDHVHPEARSRELVYKDEAIAYAGARVAAEISALRRELDEVRYSFRTVYDEVRRLAPWSESNDLPALDELLCGIGLLAQDRDEARAEAEMLRKDAERFVWQVSEWLKPQSENHRRILDAYRTGDIDAVRSAIDAAILADRGGKS